MSSISEDRQQRLNPGLAVKVPCRVASAGALILSGLQTVDGVVLAADDRILVKDQANQVDNGIYIVATGAWSRAQDFDGTYDATKGTLVLVNEGSALGRFYRIMTAAPIVFGTSAIVFELSTQVPVALSSFIQIVDTIAALKALANPGATQITYLVRGYYAVADGGGGLFRWNSADATADNGGTVIAPNAGAGRWNRIYDQADGVSTKWFGAKADGVTNDYASCQAAGAASPRVYYPAGTYLLGTGLTMTQSAHWYGDGPRKSILTRASNIDVITINAIQGWKLEGLQIQDTRASAAVTGGDGVKLTGSAMFGVLDRLYINNCYNGIHVAQAPVLRAYNVDIDYFKNAGWLFDGGTNFDAYIYGGVVNGALSAAFPLTQNGTYSIRLVDMCDEIIFNAGVFNGCVYALSTTAAVYGVGTVPEFCRFVNCSFDNSTTGMRVDQCIDMTFTGCLISNRSNGCTVGTTNSDGVTFDACTIGNNDGHGCQVDAGAKRTTFNACKVVGNSRLVANTFHGIVFADAVTDFIVSDCICTNGWGFSGTQAYGIVVNGTTHNRYTLRGNIVIGNATGGILDGTTTATPDRYVTDNVGYRTWNQGTGTILSGTTALVVNHGLAVTPVAKNITIGFTQNPTADPGNFWVDTITATQFTVNVRTNPGVSNLGFNWDARVL